MAPRRPREQAQRGAVLVVVLPQSVLPLHPLELFPVETVVDAESGIRLFDDVARHPEGIERVRGASCAIRFVVKRLRRGGAAPPFPAAFAARAATPSRAERPPSPPLARTDRRRQRLPPRERLHGGQDKPRADDKQDGRRETDGRAPRPAGMVRLFRRGGFGGRFVIGGDLLSVRLFIDARRSVSASK